jgi:pimeloyl-ACP methyl ester carboxylesterase
VPLASPPRGPCRFYVGTIYVDGGYVDWSYLAIGRAAQEWSRRSRPASAKTLQRDAITVPGFESGRTRLAAVSRAGATSGVASQLALCWVREAFAADVDPETAAVMAAAQRPYAAAAFAAAPSGPLAWKTLPCWYLLGTQDKAIPPALQRFMGERADATIVEVPASHVSFVSQPEAATQLILQAVEATAKAR